ncbi:OsmC family peroxiredoxin [Sulfolobus sp. S-194]|uniref:OsmC family protein n=1 Tax=Sulfolobus sp. S-194 TaxID=2512240 RepID=UPI0014372F44|nr:OsmC family protein [Sulfolobus sp. S-194]QIW24806.1 OsmC family peroxiredoxin [Sulfolobus sp. S-194]
MITFTAEGTLEGDKVRVSVKDTEFIIGLLGSDYPTPEEVLLASALSCLMLTVYYVANEKGLRIEKMNGYIEGNLDPKGFQGDPNIPPGFLDISYEIEVKTDNKELLEKVLEESERRCPLKDTLTRSIKVNVKWKVI